VAKYDGQIYRLEIIGEMEKGIFTLTINGSGEGTRFELEGRQVKPSQK
jgi:hypothetical protein